LVKLVIEEPESAALDQHLAAGQLLATSRIAVVEVARATAIANAAAEVRLETERLLSSCMLIGVTDALLRAAAGMASATIGTLDAIHLASALSIEPDELLAYDQRLAVAATDQGLVVISPGS
jgi:predicted nucleic acid-binding protein